MNTLFRIILVILFLAIAPVNVLPFISDETMHIYCNGNSQKIIEQYEKEIVAQEAHPTLILADIHHILQVAGESKTLSLIKELIRSASTDAEKLYVHDIVQIFQELKLQDNTKGNNRWDIYDNIKERMPKSIEVLQSTHSTLFLSGKNKISATQYQNGFIPVQRNTQDYNRIGLCSASFQANMPVTIKIYSNMDYVCYINGKKICVNSLTDKKKLVRMFRIEPEGGFTVAIYYKPIDNMFLKVQYYDDTNKIVHLPDAARSYFHDVQWYESFYDYEMLLLTQYTAQRSAQAAFQLALFYESLQCTEALRYYKEALATHNEFITCRFLSLLLQNKNIPGSEFIMRGILKENENYSSVLWQYFSDYVYNHKFYDATKLLYFPIIIHLLYKEKEELVNKKENLDLLLKRYPFSDELYYIAADITAHFDIKKAIGLLESIPTPNDKEMAFLLQCYEQDGQFEQMVSILEKHTTNRYFDTYIQALIALKRYNEAKSALFKKIAQGSDSHAYTLLATIADLEDSDGSMYRQKHEAIVSGIPWHSDYMKVAFDNYVQKKVFSRLAFETIQPHGDGLLYSCYALRIIDNNAYSTLYDLYYVHSESLVNEYAFGKDVTITGCTIHLVNKDGKLTKKKIKYTHSSIQKEIKECIKENLNTYALVEISFIVQKDIPVVHIQQNYNLSQFDMDIIVMHPHAEPYIISSLRGDASKEEHKIQHFRFNAHELSAHKTRDFVLIAITPENLTQWINEQGIRFRIADYCVNDSKIDTTTIEETASEIVRILRHHTILQNPYTATSLVQFTSSRKGTLLDAMLYARYTLAKKGIMSFISVGCSHNDIDMPCKNNTICFDTVFLYIPLTAEKGIWLTNDGTYPSLDDLKIDNILVVVGDEIIEKN